MTLVIVAALVYVIVRRAVGEPLNARDLAAPPLVLVVLGVRDIAQGDALTPIHFWGLAVVGLTAGALGAWRAATVRLYLREGELWYRYRPRTYVVWILTAIIGLGLRLVLYALFAVPASAQSLYFTVGLTLAGESVVLALRGLLSGSSFASRGRDDEGTKHLIHSEMRSTVRHRLLGGPGKSFDDR